MADPRLGAGDVRAIDAERLAEGPELQVDAPGDSRLVSGAGTMPAEHAGAMGIVDEQCRTVVLLELDDPGQWRDVTVHAEHRVGDDEHAASGPARTRELALEIIEVAVRVPQDLGAGKPAAVDDARMVEPVGDNGRVTVEQRGDRADVREIAAADHDCSLGSLEYRELLLERCACEIVGCDEPATSRRRLPVRPRPGSRERASGRRQGRDSCSTRD